MSYLGATEDKFDLQEAEYEFPYHYVPRLSIGGSIRSGISLDWSGEYLLSVELVRELISRLNPRCIFDIGCGDGRIALEAARFSPGATVVGVDSSPLAIEFAELMARRWGVSNCRFVCTDILGASWLDGIERPDLILSIEVLEHISDDARGRFASRMADILVPGGHLYSIVPHANKALIRKHYRHFTSKDIHLLWPSDVMETVDTEFIDRCTFFSKILSKLSKNRLYSINPLFHLGMVRSLSMRNQRESTCGRMAMLSRKR